MMCCGRKAPKLAVDFEHDTTLRVHARECARPPCTDHRAAFMCNPSFRLTALDELSRARFSDVVCWPFNGCYSPIVHATYKFYSRALVSVTPCQAGLRPRLHESCFTILKTSDSIAKPGRANTTSWCYDCCMENFLHKVICTTLPLPHRLSLTSVRITVLASGMERDLQKP